MDTQTLRGMLGLLVMAQVRTGEGDPKNAMNYMRCITDILVDELGITMSLSQVERLRDEAKALLEERKHRDG